VLSQLIPKADRGKVQFVATVARHPRPGGARSAQAHTGTDLRDWTDWAPPGALSQPVDGLQPLLIDAPGLLALAELVASLRRKK
jgi:hypothetical protein